MRLKAFAVCGLLAAFLCGCRVSAWDGVVGASLVRTAYPRVAIAANEPLALQGYGKQWVSFPTDYMGHQPSGFMEYAVYGEGAEGPVTRHAHALIARPSNDNYWEFKPESYPVPGGFAIGKAVLGGKGWTAQLVRIDGEKDWFSAMWHESGREVPEYWIARRFSATPEKATRVVAEYREPWPGCLDPDGIKDMAFYPKGCLDGFIERSEAAFDVAGEIPEEEKGTDIPSILVKPRFSPDMKRLVGELMEDLRIQFWR